MTRKIDRPSATRSAAARPLGIWILMICDGAAALFAMTPSLMILTAQGDDVLWTPGDRLRAMLVLALCVSILVSSIGTWFGRVMFKSFLLGLLVIFTAGLIWDSYAGFISMSRLGYKVTDFKPYVWWGLSWGLWAAFLLPLNCWYLLGWRTREFFFSDG